MKTRFTELFGVQHPLMCGGMMWIGTKELIAPVANAGALGVITALSFPTPAALAAEIQALQQLTDQPFGVNLTFLPSLRPVPYEDYVRVILESGVKIVETAGRSPEAVMPYLKQAGVKVIHKCTSLKHALKAQSLGVDCVSIDGFECAGHPGEDDVGGLVLIPKVAQALTIPVIASGGFADGRGLVAALALGAEGINMGTRFFMTQEALAHPSIKQRLLQAQETDTALVLRSLKNTARVLKNQQALQIQAAEAQGQGLDVLGPMASGLKGKEGLQSGDTEHALFTAGQVVGLIDDVPPVAELVSRIMTQADQIIRQRLAGL